VSTQLFETDSLVFIKSFGNFQSAASFDIDLNGNFYVSDIEENNIVKLDSLGNEIVSIGGYGWSESSFDRPVSIITNTLSVYVADENNDRVQRFDKDLNFRTRGKYVIVGIDQPLLANRTYSINFGRAIVDYRENNPIDNFTYVFSTGSYLDSLELKGTLKPAPGLQDLSNINVQVYAAGDSGLRYRRPLYFTRTDAGGSFNFQNLRAGSYDVYALKDVNSNYRYDQPDEYIAFLDSNL
jgi:hypothetical protein